jgi:hypothetical protein
MEESEFKCYVRAAMDPGVSLQSEYKGETYYFCSQDHKQEFQAAPEKFIHIGK